MAAPEPFEGPYGGPEGQPACAAEQFPDPATIRTLPFFKSATWMGFIGIRVDSVLHFPVPFDCAVAMGITPADKITTEISVCV